MYLLRISTFCLHNNTFASFTSTATSNNFITFTFAAESRLNMVLKIYFFATRIFGTAVATITAQLRYLTDTNVVADVVVAVTVRCSSWRQGCLQGMSR